jgi:diguanylate cyclase (GGDEF)-like protein
MNDLSWAGQAARTARTSVLIAFAIIALVIGLFVFERVVVHDSNHQATNTVRKADQLAYYILLRDERLSQSAHISAVTGDTSWVDRYNTDLEQINDAIRQATALTKDSPTITARFDATTRSANDKLVAMERRAFVLIAQGNLPAARAVLNSESYADQKRRLTQGSNDLIAAMKADADAQVESLEQRTWLVLMATLVVSVTAAWLLWQKLNHYLKHSIAAFEAEQAEVSRLAMHDTLTGLPNRRHLYLQLTQAVARTQREQTGFALVLIDLDGFKPINDHHGHAVGDKVLIEVAKRLQAAVRAEETVARLGGDEFVVLLNSGHDHDEEPRRAARRLIAAISTPMQLAVGEVRVGASAGVAIFPTDSQNYEDLIRKADLALYRAKAEGRGESRFFQESMDQDVLNRAALEMDLRNAIAKDEVVPYFQPIIELESGQLHGFEVLARWPHPTRGMVMPAEFIPLAEESGQIGALMVSVGRAALAAAKDWDNQLTISVNIAPRQLKSDELVQTLLSLLKESGFPSHRLEVEITENALIDDVAQARKVLHTLKSHGIRLALDDFGTGYSSLASLSELPFDKIKIDRSFIQTMHINKNSETIVNAIIGLGKSMNLSITAEGIETRADADLLTKLGCHRGQGYLFSRAVPAQEALVMISQQRLKKSNIPVA